MLAQELATEIRDVNCDISWAAPTAARHFCGRHSASGVASPLGFPAINYAVQPCAGLVVH